MGHSECDGNFSLKDHAQNLDCRWKLDERVSREKCSKRWRKQFEIESLGMLDFCGRVGTNGRFSDFL